MADRSRIGNPPRTRGESPLSDTMFWDESQEATQPKSVGSSSFIGDVSLLFAASRIRSQTAAWLRVSPGICPRTAREMTHDTHLANRARLRAITGTPPAIPPLPVTPSTTPAGAERPFESVIDNIVTLPTRHHTLGDLVDFRSLDAGRLNWKPIADTGQAGLRIVCRL